MDPLTWKTQLLKTYETTTKDEANFKRIEILLTQMVDDDLIQDNTVIGVAKEALKNEPKDENGVPNDPLALLTEKDVLSWNSNGTGDEFVTDRSDTKIKINGTVTGWIGNRKYTGKQRYTGMYAEPGKVVTVTIPENMVNKK